MIVTIISVLIGVLTLGFFIFGTICVWASLWGNEWPQKRNVCKSNKSLKGKTVIVTGKN